MVFLKVFLRMFTGFCWFSAAVHWILHGLLQVSDWNLDGFLKVFLLMCAWLCCEFAAFWPRPSGTPLSLPRPFSSLIMSMSLPMDVSAETGAAGTGSLDHLNDPDKRNRLATRSLYNLQQEIFAYRSGKDCRGYVHSSGLCTYDVLKGRVRWEFLVFCLIFHC